MYTWRYTAILVTTILGMSNVNGRPEMGIKDTGGVHKVLGIY